MAITKDSIEGMLDKSVSSRSLEPLKGLSKDDWDSYKRDGSSAEFFGDPNLFLLVGELANATSDEEKNGVFKRILDLVDTSTSNSGAEKVFGYLAADAMNYLNFIRLSGGSESSEADLREVLDKFAKNDWNTFTASFLLKYTPEKLSLLTKWYSGELKDFPLEIFSDTPEDSALKVFAVVRKAYEEGKIPSGQLKDVDQAISHSELTHREREMLRQELDLQFSREFRNAFMEYYLDPNNATKRSKLVECSKGSYYPRKTRIDPENFMKIAFSVSYPNEKKRIHALDSYFSSRSSDDLRTLGRAFPKINLEGINRIISSGGKLLFSAKRTAGELLLRKDWKTFRILKTNGNKAMVEVYDNPHDYFSGTVPVKVITQEVEILFGQSTKSVNPIATAENYIPWGELKEGDIFSDDGGITRYQVLRVDESGGLEITDPNGSVFAVDQETNSSDGKVMRIN